MMKWMRERDLLIAQTMAFVQSVTGKKPELTANGNSVGSFEAAALADAPQPMAVAKPMPDIEAMLAETITTHIEPRKPATIARSEPKVDFQSEIRARVANFRAHQERFNREREAYCSATMAKVHAALREDAVPPRPGK
jgi:hypothetical protein